MGSRPSSRTKLERTALPGQVLTWLTSRSPRSMLLAVVGVIAFGTVGYMIVGGVGVLDGLYMAVITVSTVGYGDLVDSDVGHLFSAVYIVLGVGVVSLTISTLASALVAGRVHEALGRRRMERQISELAGHLVLCGYGRIGRIAALQIRERGVPLVVIDADPARVDEADEDGMLGIVADATEESSLERAGIARAEALLCTLPSDADNVYVILNARETRPEMRIVALARGVNADRKLLRAGAQHVVSPYSIGARHLARQILSPNVAQVMNLAAGEQGGLEQVGVRLEEYPIAPGSALIGQRLRDSPIRRDFGVILVAVVDPDGGQHFNPGPELVLSEGAVLVSVGPPSGLKRLATACGVSPPIPTE